MVFWHYFLLNTQKMIIKKCPLVFLSLSICVNKVNTIYDLVKHALFSRNYAFPTHVLLHKKRNLVFTFRTIFYFIIFICPLVLCARD